MGAAEQIVDDSRYGERPKRVGSVSAGDNPNLLRIAAQYLEENRG